MLKHPAEFTVHTPTGPVHSCVKHARQIEGLMRMLGAHTHAVKAPDGVECANCINEAKAKGDTHAPGAILNDQAHLGGAA